MILILSDLFEALWFMVYAVAALAPGSVDSALIFCQLSGFFTAVGVESSGMRGSSWPISSEANCCRLCSADDCRTQRSVHIQTADFDC
jgi:hypothetical protein